MRIERTPESGLALTLERQEVELLRLALERATFVDTPPGRQTEIYRFAEDLLKAIAP